MSAAIQNITDVCDDLLLTIAGLAEEKRRTAKFNRWDELSPRVVQHQRSRLHLCCVIIEVLHMEGELLVSTYDGHSNPNWRDDMLDSTSEEVQCYEEDFTEAELYNHNKIIFGEDWELYFIQTLKYDWEYDGEDY